MALITTLAKAPSGLSLARHFRTTGLALAVLAAGAASAHAACVPGGATLVSVTDYNAVAIRKSAELRLAESELAMLGCSRGSIIVIGGPNSSACAILQQNIPVLRAELDRVLDERDRLRAGIAPEPCAAPDQNHAAAAAGNDPHSQFRDSAATTHPSGLTIVSAPVPSPAPTGLGDPTPTSAIPEPEAAGAMAHIDPHAGLSSAGELLPAPGRTDTQLEATDMHATAERRPMPDRAVRVVGPQFLPDLSEAIDLTAPGRRSAP
jgi:hypothetical protein